MTWHPRGVLDDRLLDEIAYFTHTLDHIVEAPFDRFIDLSGLAEIHLKVEHVFEIAEERKTSHAGLAKVKSAVYSDKIIGFGVARMYETLMEGSSIDVLAFRVRSAAAAWLGVPIKLLDDVDNPETETFL